MISCSRVTRVGKINRQRSRRSGKLSMVKAGHVTDHRGPRVIRKPSALGFRYTARVASCHYYSRDSGCVGSRPATATTVSPAELQGHYDCLRPLIANLLEKLETSDDRHVTHTRGDDLSKVAEHASRRTTCDRFSNERERVRRKAVKICLV